MNNGNRPAPKPLGSPQKFRPGGPPKKKKSGALNDPLLLLPDVLDDATRKQLLQEVMRPRCASSSIEHPSRSPHGGSGNNGGGPHPDKEPFADQLRSRVRAGSQNGDDLLTAMAARLKELESKHKAYQSELQELHTKYRHLNDKYQHERQLREETETAVLTLYNEKELLEKKLEALESATGAPRDRTATSHSPSKDRRAVHDAALDVSISNGSATSTPTRRSPSKEKFDLFSGDFYQGDGEKITPTHFTNTARPGTLLFSPQKTNVDSRGEAAAAEPKAPQQARTKKEGQRHSAATVDVALLQKNARILSDYVGWKGVVKQGNMAGIRERDIVRVVVYKNGICVNRGPFRPFGWALCDAFLDDLAEGYYPYEFKEKYPDGFPIEVTDRSSETCEVDENGAARAKTGATATAVGEGRTISASPAFPSDGGRRLGGASLEAGKPQPIHTVQNLKDDGGYAPISAVEFLRKMPVQRVTASGQLVPVRSEIAALMGVKGGGATTTTTPSENAVSSSGPSNTVKRVAAAEAASRRAKAHQREQPSTTNSPPNHLEDNEAAGALSGGSSIAASNLLAILVRLPNGRTVTLHMAPEDTVAVLRKKFVTAAPQFAEKAYELCQGFPLKCVWKEHFRTLASLGIQKSCTLMVKLE